MSEVQVFTHTKFGQHTVRTDERGNAVFVLSPIAKTLDYRDAEKAKRILDRDEYWLEVVDLPTPERGTSQVRRRVLVVSESGLYHLIFASTKPEAKKFRRWVTEEVLPTLRRANEVGIDAVEEIRRQTSAKLAEKDRIIDRQRQELVEQSMDYEDHIEEITLIQDGSVAVRHPHGRISAVSSFEALAAHRRKVAAKTATR